MKWYWMLLIVVASVAIIYIVYKMMNKAQPGSYESCLNGCIKEGFKDCVSRCSPNSTSKDKKKDDYTVNDNGTINIPFNILGRQNTSSRCPVGYHWCGTCETPGCYADNPTPGFSINRFINNFKSPTPGLR